MPRPVIAKHLSKATNRNIRFFRFSLTRSAGRVADSPTRSQTGSAKRSAIPCLPDPVWATSPTSAKQRSHQ